MLAKLLPWLWADQQQLVAAGYGTRLISRAISLISLMGEQQTTKASRL
jgi:hypothetical protein